MARRVSRPGLLPFPAPRSALALVRGVALVLGAVAIGCASESTPAEDLTDAPDDERGGGVSEAAAQNASLPEAPALARDVAMIADSQYTHPTTPSFRTSADGRVSINLKGTGGGTTFRLIKPEALNGPFAAQPAGTPMVEAAGKTLPDSAIQAHAAGLGAGDVQHRTLCDATPQLPKAGSKTNPYACGAGGASDCYDLTIIASYPYTASGQKRVELWGTPVTVRVDSPKTADASIGQVTHGAPVKGPTWTVGNILEPMITTDGHLLVGRVGGSSFTWKKANGTKVTGEYDIVYSVAPAGAAPCDVTKWSELYPASHAAHHPGLSKRYGFAHYPLRDPENKPIADGADLKATYPWIDRQGNNLFFTTVSATLYYTDPQGVVRSRYPASCVPGVACSTPTKAAQIGTYDESSSTRGVTVAGLWTHGKMVLLDNLLNNVDYGLRVADDLQRMLKLYEPNSGPKGDETGRVRAGSGRANTLDGAPSVTTTNTTFIDSQENLFQHAPNARALTVRDVVWTVHTGHGSDEVVFDDYLDPDALVFSEMSGSLSYTGGSSTTALAYHDGFQRASGFGGGGFTEEIRVQNAATAIPERWAIPAYGTVKGGARLEPVALGGIRGKGLWLDGNDSIEYTFPAQPTNIHAVPLFVSIFLDSRFADDGVARRLFTFPDGSAIEVVGRTSLRFLKANGAVQVTYALPDAAPLVNKTFTHLGFGVASGGGQVDVYLDGLLYSTWSSASVKLFRFVPGIFRVGAAAGKAGVRGWIDEVKVLASAPDPEVACNHARGTLIGLPSGYDGPWKAVADRYPATSHATISTRLAGAGEATFDAYACFHAYTDEHGAHLGNIPSGTISVRRGLLFPESPLVWDQPRPDSSTNTFCLGCHVAGQRDSLTPAALTLDPATTMAEDRRRQPLQPPRLIFGNVPAGYVPETGLPATSKTAPEGGLSLDAWMFP